MDLVQMLAREPQLAVHSDSRLATLSRIASRFGRRALRLTVIASTLLVLLIPAGAAADSDAAAAGPLPSPPRAAPISMRDLPRGSIFVPLDSWIYPALRRLAALGFIPDQNSLLAPWTRSECAHQIDEAADLTANDTGDPAIAEALRLLSDLQAEFSNESERADALTFDSAYTQITGIGGIPLRDSYHFGQTVVNNYGRRYERGVNNDSGLSASASFGRFFGYVRGEYQFASGRGPDDLTQRQVIAFEDQNPLQPGRNVATTNHFDVLETYVGAQFGFENVSFGKESLWWGPGSDSAFAFSNNAEPFYMLNFDQTRGIALPGVLRRLGTWKTQFIFGRLQGHQFPPRPLVNAQKITLDITPNLELGITRSAFWGGVGHPETLHSFEQSLFSTSSTGTFRYGDRTDPGDRHTGFDFRWRLPGLRRFATLYSDSYADDEVNPLANPDRSAWAPGLYIAQIPHMTKVDFRVETYSTWLYSGDHGSRFEYWNSEYHDSYTNDQFLLGSWIGRDARAYDVSAGYWVSARTRFQAQYRQLKDAPRLLPGGGTQTDGSLTLQWSISPDLLVNGLLQFERYNIPVLGGRHDDGIASLQITYTPRDAHVR